jgi:hypothetical protein
MPSTVRLRSAAAELTGRIGSAGIQTYSAPARAVAFVEPTDPL